MTKQNPTTFFLSFIAGYVDTAGFIALSGIFTAHITGNLVLAGSSIAQYHKYDDVFSRLILIPVFVVGVILTASVIKRLQYDDKNKLRFLFIVQAFLLLLFSFSGVAIFSDWVAVHTVTGIIIQASLAVLAMAIQNTYLKLLLPNFMPTTVMTGNITNFSIGIENFLSTFSIRKPIKLSAAAYALLGFSLGCVGGAFGVVEVGLLCILFPVLILILLAFFK
jgi:uncharacterized membrane protein YoaK (UPF0700 family)